MFTNKQLATFTCHLKLSVDNYYVDVRFFGLYIQLLTPKVLKTVNTQKCTLN